MKYPIGIQSFDKIINGDYVYVDKTDLVYSLVTEGACYFLGRPRRLGKTIVVSTLEHYFLGHKELFKGLKIDSLEKDWLEYPVFHINLNAGDFTRAGTLENILEGHVATWEQVYGRSDIALTVSGRFKHVLQEAHKRTGRRCVVLVDDYDKPILRALGMGIETTVNGRRMLLEDYNCNVLRAFYSVFKAADADLQFVFVTGEGRLAQLLSYSGFNQLCDISLTARYDTLCGITQEELEHYFAEPIAAMAAERGISVDEMKVLLKRQYGGYHFSEKMTDVYNPNSLYNAFSSGDMWAYGFTMGSPTYMARMMPLMHSNFYEITRGFHMMDFFTNYRAETGNLLPLIYQSGYLTIKDYRQQRDTFLLDFPNNEVKDGLISWLASDYWKLDTAKIGWKSRDLVLSMRQGDPETLRKLMTGFLAGIPYTMRRKEDERERERYFHYTFYLIFNMVSIYTVYTEKEQSEGRVDCIVETDKYVYIFEFKLDGTASEALAQIEAKGYARPYEADARKLFRIGAVFSSQTGTISDWAVV